MTHHGHHQTHGEMHDAAHAGDYHDVGIAKYVYVFLALCVLTGASFFT